MKNTEFGFALFGGPEETRTLDLSDANRTLSQLSYRPENMNIIAMNRGFVKAFFWESPRRGFLCAGMGFITHPACCGG